MRSIKFKAPVTSSEPQIVLVSVNEGILSTNTFFFLDEELITNDDDEGSMDDDYDYVDTELV